MSITSFNFVFFMAAVSAVCFLTPKRCQYIVLLLFSMYFYAQDGWKSLAFLGVTVVVSYYTAICIERVNTQAALESGKASTRTEKASIRKRAASKRRIYFVPACVLIFGIWAVVKYSGMVLNTAQTLNASADLSYYRYLAEKLPVPMGISFYTFNICGYMVDIGRRRYKAERNILKYLLYISFFPHIIQGPFSRYNRLGKTLFEPHRFNFRRMCDGMARILTGYCKKLLIADKLSASVAEVMSSPASSGGVSLFVAVIGYGFQLYADFSGYMDIMCGFCRILGIELEENFRQPYFSTSVQNYWTRWHMTLGEWFRDYIFYPISLGSLAQKMGQKTRKVLGPRMGTLVPSFFAMFFVWTLTGLWHGARWTFVVWGWMNFGFIALTMLLDPLYGRMKKALHIRDTSFPWHVFQILRTFLVVSFMRIFQCSETIGLAFIYVKKVFTANPAAILHLRTILKFTWVYDFAPLTCVLAGLVLMFFQDLYHENKCTFRFPYPLRCVFYAILICALLIFASQGDSTIGGFMYANY